MSVQVVEYDEFYIIGFNDGTGYYMRKVTRFTDAKLTTEEQTITKLCDYILKQQVGGQ